MDQSKRQRVILYLSSLLIHYALYLIIPLLPILLKRQAGLGPGQVSIVVGSQVLAIPLGSLLNGLLSLRIGKRQSLFIGNALLATATGLLPITTRFFLLLILAIVFGIGNGLIAPTIKTALSEATENDHEKQTVVFSYRSVFANVGLALAGITIFIIERSRPHFIFAIAIGTTVLLFLLVYRYIPRHHLKTHKPPRLRLQSLIDNKRFLIFSIFILTINFGYAQLPFLLPLRIDAVYGTTETIGLIWLFMSLQVILFQLPIGKFLLPRFHPLIAYMLALLFFTIGILGIGFSTSLPLLFLSSCLFTFGQLLMSPTTDRLTNQFSDPNFKGVYFSLVNLLTGLGGALGTYASGYFIASFTILKPIAFLIIGGFLLLFSIFIFIMRRSRYFHTIDAT